jgi:hypothetical protein
MRTIKQEVETILQQLPDDCSLEDIQYRLYLLEKVRLGMQSVETEGSVPHAQAKEHLQKWLIP